MHYILTFQIKEKQDSNSNTIIKLIQEKKQEASYSGLSSGFATLLQPRKKRKQDFQKQLNYKSQYFRRGQDFSAELRQRYLQQNTNCQQIMFANRIPKHSRDLQSEKLSNWLLSNMKMILFRCSNTGIISNESKNLVHGL